MNSRLVFLLGAGISVPAGLPSTSQLTQIVRSGSGVRRLSDGTFSTGGPELESWLEQSHVPLIRSFIKRIEAEINSYYSHKTQRKTNYEDVYYVVSQVWDSESREYDNPVVQAFVDKIGGDSRQLIEKFSCRGIASLSELAGETCHYIHDLVARKLSVGPTDFSPFVFIRDSLLDSGIDSAEVFTLNHDTALEKFLFSHGVPYDDGFASPVAGVRYWNPDTSLASQNKSKLWKLHGSVNWHRLRPDNGDWSNERMGIVVSGDPMHAITESGDWQNSVDGRPILLIGTFNKILRYSSGLFAFIHNRLRISLQDCSLLVICGYGFGDKGINAAICDWVYSVDNPRMLVVHPSPESLFGRARGAIRGKWRRWKNDGILRLVPKKVENTEWSDIAVRG